MASSPISSFYDGSFGGTSFWEQYEGGLSANEPDVRTNEAILEIPGGNAVVYQDFGQGAQTLELPVAVMAAELAALRAKRGVSGSLVWHSGTNSARLRHVTNARRVALDSDGYLCQLNFLML